MSLHELNKYLCCHSRCASCTSRFIRCATFSKDTFELKFHTYQKMLRWIYPLREIMRKKRPGSMHFSDGGLSSFRRAHAYRRTMRDTTTNIYSYLTEFYTLKTSPENWYCSGEADEEALPPSRQRNRLPISQE